MTKTLNKLSFINTPVNTGVHTIVPTHFRKIIVSLNISLDGFISGPRNELDWHFNYWDAEMAEVLGQELHRADTLLLGRITYEAMAGHWPVKLLDLQQPREDIAFAEMMNAYRKVVVSNTIQILRWPNSRLINGNVSKAIRTLKAETGKDIMVYGSGQLVNTLWKGQWIDELQLWLHPILLGSGKSLFDNISHRPLLHLQHSRHFESGVVFLKYSVKKSND